jgi:hypothetical protein
MRPRLKQLYQPNTNGKAWLFAEVSLLGLSQHVRKASGNAGFYRLANLKRILMTCTRQISRAVLGIQISKTTTSSALQEYTTE